MDREFVETIYREQKRIFITLKTRKVFSGTIEKIGKTSIVVLDKFGDEVPISLDAIQHIEPERKKKENGKTNKDY